MKKTIVSTDPATGKKLGEYPLNSVKDIYEIVERAGAAQKKWAEVPVKERVRYIKKIRDYIVEQADRIAETISLDNGKTLVDAMATEVVPAAMAADYYRKKARRFMKDSGLRAGNFMFINKRSTVVRVPYGVIGIISPWNYPFSIPFSEVIMALLAGNTVLLKVARETSMVGDLLKECFEAAGFPENVFNYVNSPGSITGDAFIDAGVNKIFFTGSVETGKYLMKQASKKLIPLVLELGGNDAMIVCEDADIERSVDGAVWAGLQNAGQSCGGVERIYVHESVYKSFLTVLKERVEALRIGIGQDFNTDIGPITVERQIKTINSHIRDALKKGATVYAQCEVPKNLKGQFLPCVVLTDVTHDMLVMKEETFGPVLGVMPYGRVEEALEMANDSHLGLTASVWSSDRSKAKTIARGIKAGAVLINDHLMSHGMAETFWGGFKESGIGRTHGEVGFMEMTQPQLILDDIMPFGKRNFWWHPYSKDIYDGLKGVVTSLYSRSIPGKVLGMFKLMKVFTLTFRGRR